MRIPIVLLVGQANSGKDTIARIISKQVKNVSTLAFADPIKRLAKSIFDIDEKYLWGPSSQRGVPLDEFSDSTKWEMAYGKILMMEKLALEGFSATVKSLPIEALPALKSWFAGFYETFNKGNQPLSARLVLQSLGTEFGRKYDQQMWTNLAINHSMELLNGGYIYDSKTGMVQSKSMCDLVVVSDGRFRNEILAVKQAGGVVVRVTCPQNPENTLGHASEQEQKSVPAYFFDYNLVNDKNKSFKDIENQVDALCTHLKLK